MDIIDVRLIIRLIPNQMIPKTLLPYSSLTTLGSTIGNSLACFDAARKIAFDQPPARGKILIT